MLPTIETPHFLKKAAEGLTAAGLLFGLPGCAAPIKTDLSPTNTPQLVETIPLSFTPTQTKADVAPTATFTPVIPPTTIQT